MMHKGAREDLSHWPQVAGVWDKPDEVDKSDSLQEAGGSCPPMVNTDIMMNVCKQKEKTVQFRSVLL